VVVAAIDQCDIDWGALEFPRGAEAAETTAQNHHSLTRSHFASSISISFQGPFTAD
jgi:hypothetical protein